MSPAAPAVGLQEFDSSGMQNPHSGQVKGDPEYRFFKPLWIPGGVYPDENRGRNDEIAKIMNE
jgi:hypothetical protein